jgi:hypothetical protein
MARVIHMAVRSTTAMLTRRNIPVNLSIRLGYRHAWSLGRLKKTEAVPFGPSSETQPECHRPSAGQKLLFSLASAAREPMSIARVTPLSPRIALLVSAQNLRKPMKTNGGRGRTRTFDFQLRRFSVD